MTRIAAARRLIRPGLGSEAGFTLIELMMAIVILGIIIGPLTAGLIVGLRTSADTQNRLTGSNDAQMLSIYLPPDVQSADDAITSAISCTGVTGAVLQLKSTVYDTSFNVAYAVILASDGSYQLVRNTCPAGTQKIIARNLANATAVTITRTPASGTLQRVSMQVTEKATAGDPTNYVFTVTASRRTS